MDEKKEKDLRHLIHQSIQKVTDDIKLRFNFNTAISAIMELVNGAYQYKEQVGSANTKAMAELIYSLIVMMAPFTPHLSEELFSALGKESSVHLESWPKVDETALVVDEVEIVIQVNGKLKDRLLAGVSESKESVLAKAKDLPKVKEALTGKTIKKEIVVPGKLINIVIG